MSCLALQLLLLSEANKNNLEARAGSCISVGLQASSNPRLDWARFIRSNSPKKHVLEQVVGISRKWSEQQKANVAHPIVQDYSAPWLQVALGVQQYVVGYHSGSSQSQHSMALARP